MAEIEGREYFFLLFKYDPPLHFPPYLLESREEQDLSAPEGTIIALASAKGRDRDWMLSLRDEIDQKRLLKHDELSGGRVLREHLKGTPLPDPLERAHFKLLYKAELQVNNRKYAVIQMTVVSDDKVPDSPVTMSFVKQDNAWLRTVGPRHPIASLVGRKSYDELVQMSRRVD